jgi:glycosyltransferase involved in cell wall biosynthesis
MIHGKKVIVVMPAYKAVQTLDRTYQAIPKDIVDDVLLIDDASPDATLEEARRLGLKTFVHQHNLGYGANQKTCYREALRAGADIVVMLHPDYQYDPRLITAMAAMIASDVYDVVLGSRILGGSAIRGGMPFYKYVANRFLTLFQNILLRAKLSEYHTGYRAFSRRVLRELPLLANSDDFVFDNEMLTQAIAFGFAIGEISCPTKYFAEASSINFRRSVTYGFGVLGTSIRYRLWKWGLAKSRLFSSRPTLRLEQDYYRPAEPPASQSLPA